MVSVFLRGWRLMVALGEEFKKLLGGGEECPYGFAWEKGCPPWGEGWGPGRKVALLERRGPGRKVALLGRRVLGECFMQLRPSTDNDREQQQRHQ